MNLFSELLQDARMARAVRIVTVITAPPECGAFVGQHMLVYGDGTWKGCILDESFAGRVRDRLMELNPSQPLRFTLPEAAGIEMFCDRLALTRRAVVFGGGHISQPLVEILSMVGYEVTIADDRPDFANEARFPAARRVLCCSFADAFAQLAVTQATAVVIVTRGHLHDLDCLRFALQKDVFYLGMIGSKHKVATVFEALRQEGADPEALRKVRAPIGLDIHAQTPAEIALSIAAEIVSAEKGGTCLPICGLGGGSAR